MDTTCACPAFAYRPEHSAAVVDRLEAAGAILIGKTNLDQFATGLVGIRSPYGEVSNPFDADYVSGGSSSGSAAAVALGLVPFALGTDTAGSGRVPAGFCNLVGIKPTPGSISTAACFPACKSLDCVSILRATVRRCLDGRIGGSPGSIRRTPTRAHRTAAAARSPRASACRRVLDFLGDQAATERVRPCPRHPAPDAQFEFVELDFEPLHADRPAALRRTLGRGALRLAIGEFFDAHEAADGPDRARDHRQGRRQIRDRHLQGALPTRSGQADGRGRLRPGRLPAGADRADHPQASHGRADPIARNSDFGLYTNFVNLLGMSALALPGPVPRRRPARRHHAHRAAGGDHRLAELRAPHRTAAAPALPESRRLRRG
jgi:allophanate hydrolase